MSAVGMVMTGECRAVVISGSDDRVLVERVGSLNVSGMNNTVRRGL